MKKVVIPEKTTDKIYPHEIDTHFKGLIIGYKDNVPVGFYQYLDNEETWFFFNGSNVEDCIDKISERTLTECIQKGIESKIFNELRVMEFSKEKD